MSRRDTIEEMSRIAENRGGKCLSTAYTNQKKPLRWECSEGHEWETAPVNIKGSKKKPGTWCPECGMEKSARRRMHTVEDMVRLASDNDGRFVSDSYLGTAIKHLWRCNQYPSHPEFWKIPATVVQGQWCPKCSGNTKPTLADLQALAEQRNDAGRLLSTVYENSATPLEWFCGVEGHPTFMKPYRSVKFDGGWCRKCSYETRRPRKYDREMLMEFARTMNAELISSERYRSTKQQLIWRCADGHTFTRTLGSIIACGAFCSKCNKYLREESIRQLFEYTFDAIFRRRRDIPWLVNDRGNRMELDGYNEQLSIAFEHQGQQHEAIVAFFSPDKRDLQRRIEDDREKTRLCEENGVKLIVIWYNVSMDALQDHLLCQLDERAIHVPNREPFTIGMISPSKLGEFRTIAQERGGTLLSDRYTGSGANLEWKCGESDHPPFKATPGSIVGRGSWCRKCDSQRRSESNKFSLDTVRSWARASGGELVTVGDLGTVTRSFGLSEVAEFRCSSCQRQQSRIVRVVRDGRLCLCHTNKVRIDRDRVSELLAKRGAGLVEPVSITGGASEITVECERCKSRWPTRARNVLAGDFGCPKCRKNARITVERAREIGDQAGFDLLETDVDGGKQVLHWRCRVCGIMLLKPCREMRNLRRCRECARLEAVSGLVALRAQG